MATGRESGKMTLFKGTMTYLWEEIKTMNRRKLRALSRMLAGYIRMKFREREKPRIEEERTPHYRDR